MKRVLAVAIMFAALPLGAQQLTPTPRPGFLAGDTVEIIIVDARRKTDDYAKLPGVIIDAFRDAYPAAVVRQQPDSVYYQPARTGVITIKLQLLGYARGFGLEAGAAVGLWNGSPLPMVVPQGKWNGITAFGVNVFDKRSGKDARWTTTFDRVVSRSNTWGYRSGNQAMQESFAEAVNALLVYIDGTFLG